MFSFKIDDDTRLELLEQRHSKIIFAIIDRDREYLREWLPWVDLTKSPDDTDEFIESTLRQFAANKGFQAAIVYKNAFAGIIGFHAIDWDHKRTSIGYWLARDAQGRGLMSRACAALVNHALVTLGLERVEIRCATGNTKSQAIPERLGFTFEGISRNYEVVNGKSLDHRVYSMLKSEWTPLQEF
ncbi:MAG TPA: GNAT family protein [Bdellovibrionales bacterium]|nr:GNAT family protein [Bdellovibrionales bacterium]